MCDLVDPGAELSPARRFRSKGIEHDQQIVHALLPECGPKADREKPARSHQHRRVLKGNLPSLKEALHQFFVTDCDLLLNPGGKNCLPGTLSAVAVILIPAVLIPAVLIPAVLIPAVLIPADFTLKIHTGASQFRADLLIDRLPVRPCLIHFVDKNKSRNPVMLQQFPKSADLSGDFVRRAYDQNRIIQHLQHTFHLRGKIHMAGCIHQGPDPLRSCICRE